MVAITYFVAFLPVALSLPAFHLPTLPTLPSITKLLNTAVDDDAPTFSNASDIVPGKYIVTFKPGVIATQFDLHMNWVRDIHARSVRKRAAGKSINEAVKAGVDKVWFDNFKGYSGEFDDETIATIAKSNTVCIHLPPSSLDQANFPRFMLLSQCELFRPARLLSRTPRLGVSPLSHAATWASRTTDMTTAVVRACGPMSSTPV